LKSAFATLLFQRFFQCELSPEKAIVVVGKSFFFLSLPPPFFGDAKIIKFDGLSIPPKSRVMRRFDGPAAIKGNEFKIDKFWSLSKTILHR
jgi:hypothetical protein